MLTGVIAGVKSMTTTVSTSCLTIVIVRPLETRRYLLLLRQLADDPDIRSERQAALRLKIDPSYAVKLRTEESREVDLDVLRRAQAALRLDRRFFFDPSLGSEPNYRDHIVGSHVELDESRGTPNVEAAIAAREASGRALPDDVIEVARGWRSNTGDFDPLMIEMMLNHELAKTAGRAVPDRAATAGAIEEDRGQRRLVPPKKGRRR